MPDQRCAHINAIASAKHPKRRECEDCVKIGATWVHLRMTGLRRYAFLRRLAKPSRDETRPRDRSSVIASAEAGERWLYCYPDDELTEY